MTLNTKTRFSVRLNSLLAAIADGRGMSQLSFLDDGTEEEAYIEPELTQEHSSASHTDEHQQEEPHVSDHEHGSEHENFPTEESRASLKNSEEQEQSSDATAVQAHESQVKEQNAAFEEQPALQQPEETLASAQEQHEAQEYAAGTSPAPEDLPEFESSDEGNVPEEKEHDRDVEETSRTGAPQDSRENDQIDYDDGENAEDTKDDASYRSSTLQGDNTPATFDESASQLDNASGVPTDTSAMAATSVAGLPQDGVSNAEDRVSLAAPHDGLTAPKYAEEETPNLVGNSGEEHESEHHINEQDLNEAEEEALEQEALEQELERELNNQGDSFDLPHDYTENPDGDQYSTNYGDGEEYGYEQEGDGQETQVGEGTYEEYAVVDTEDVQQSTGVPDAGLDDGQELSHDYGFDEATAEQTTENQQDGTELAFDEQLQHDGPEQAQPAAHASDEDDLDTIDYDDEELSQNHSPQNDEAAAQSPSSAKRAWEELGQDDDDQANEQGMWRTRLNSKTSSNRSAAPKKVKSE